MGFSGNAINSTEKTASTDYNEIKNNIDTTANELGVSTYSGTSDSSISEGDIITSSSINELRDATDYLDNQNYCHTHYSSYDSGYDSGYNSAHDSSYDGTYDSGQDSGYDSSHDSTYDSGENATHNGSYDSGYDSSHFVGYHNGYTI